MRFTFSKSLLAASVLLALGSQAAFATNGLAPTGIGMVHRSMGGTAVANPENTTSMATNPAAASFIADGYDVGLELFAPDRSVKVTTGMPGAGTEFSGNGKTTFLIPEGGYKRQINDKVSAGVVVYGNGGMNTEYVSNPFAPARTDPKAGVDYQQLFVSPTISYKINDNHAIGASVNLVQHKIRVNTGIPGSDVGYDGGSGVGATIGWQGKISPKTTAGISYRAKTKMGKIKDYAFLGDMDVPGATTIGISHQATPKTRLTADIQKIDYSDVEAIGKNFSWEDQTVYKVGVKHQVTDNVALMAGYNHGKSPIGSGATSANVLAPGVVENHLSLGTEVKLSPKSKLIASYVHAFENEVKGNGTAAGAYDLKMSQHAVGIAFSHNF